MFIASRSARKTVALGRSNRCSTKGCFKLHSERLEDRRLLAADAPMSLSSVHGLKWEDLNGNGEQESGELGLGGVTIYSDVNNNGQLDPTDPQTVTMEENPFTDFDEGGLYWLPGLESGVHTIREVVPDDYQQTSPGPGTLLQDVDSRRLSRSRATAFGLIHVDGGPTNGPAVNVDLTYRIDWSTVCSSIIDNATEHSVQDHHIQIDMYARSTSDMCIQIVAPPERHRVHVDDVKPGTYKLETRLHEPVGAVLPAFEQTWEMTGVLTVSRNGSYTIEVHEGNTIEGINFGNQPRREPGSIHGRKWADRDGDGRRDKNEPGIAGVTIYVDQNHNIQFDADEPHAVTIADNPDTDFDEAGLYWLQNLEPGFHVVREIVPDGFEQTFPDQPLCRAIFCSGRPHFVNLDPGQTVRGVDFGNRPLTEDGAIHGQKWEDINGNGVREDHEPGLPGVTIYLDLNYNIQHDDNEPFAVTMKDNPNTAIDESGRYRLDVRPGFYLVHEVVPDGFEQTFPEQLTCRALFCNGPGHLVNVAPGQIVEGIDFGNVRVPVPGSIHGRKWRDDNGNRRHDDNEPGLAGVIIYVDSNRNTRLDRGEPRTRSMADDPDTDVDETGRYWLEGLRPGRHIVREIVPDGFTQSFPPRIRPFPIDILPIDVQSVDLGSIDLLQLEGTDSLSTAEFDRTIDSIDNVPIPVLQGAHIVDLSSGEVVKDINFGNVPNRGSVHGLKWHDSDGDGRRDRNEPGLPGVTIYVDLNRNGALDNDEPHTVTVENDPVTDFDEGGRYWLEGVPAGRQVIREILPDGFVQTFPRNLVGIAPDIAAVDNLLEIDDFRFSDVDPEEIIVALGDGDVLKTEVSLAINPICFRAFHVDVVPTDPDVDFHNLSGVQVNGCGGETSTFEIQITGDGSPHHFDLQFVNAELGSMINTIPVSIAVPGRVGGHVVNVPPGGIVKRIDFGNRPIEPASVHGVKWLDEDADGKRDPDEPGFPGVVIFSDLNDNGVYNQGEPRAVTMKDDPHTDFDEGGHYWLTGLRPGKHQVREMIPPGYLQTFPKPTSSWPSTPHVLVLSAGQTLEEIDFGNRFFGIPGDTDLDGDVEFDDFVDLTNNFGETNASWEQGDFTGEGTIGFRDFVLQSNNFGVDTGISVAAAAVTDADVDNANAGSDREDTDRSEKHKRLRRIRRRIKAAVRDRVLAEHNLTEDVNVRRLVREIIKHRRHTHTDGSTSSVFSDGRFLESLARQRR